MYFSLYSSIIFFLLFIIHLFVGTTLKNEICYDLVGCFQPLDHPQFSLYPESPTVIGTQFRLYDKYNPIKFNNIHYSKLHSNCIQQCPLKSKSKVAIIIHGWMFHQDIEMYGRLRAALFNVYNQLIAVDWRGGADNAFYPQSAANTVLVGREVALLINKLAIYCEINVTNAHLIGFSLGAHVAGNAGKWLQTKFNKKLGRISALDGAGVLLRNSSIALNKNDAFYVDAIHTTGGMDDGEALLAQFGNPYPVGHVDFYPNGGRDQSHCRINPPYGPFCLHHAAIDFYISSITQCSYVAYKCTSWTDYLKGTCNGTETSRMGFYSTLSKSRGNFFLATEPNWPYCERRTSFLEYLFPSTYLFQKPQGSLISFLNKG